MVYRGKQAHAHGGQQYLLTLYFHTILILIAFVSKSGLLWRALPATSIMEISKEKWKLFLFWQIHHDTAASFRQKVLILCLFVITAHASSFVRSELVRGILHASAM